MQASSPPRTYKRLMTSTERSSALMIPCQPNGCVASRQPRQASAPSARGARQHTVRTLSTPARGKPGGAQQLGWEARVSPCVLSLWRQVGRSWGGRTHVKEVLVDGLPDDDIDEVPSKWAQVQAASISPDALGPGCYGGLAQERAEPGARRGGRGVKHVGRQACLGGPKSVVHIDASLRVSATASSVRYWPTAVQRRVRAGPQRVSGPARVASCAWGRRACWLGKDP